jgi:hypothetical protein
VKGKTLFFEIVEAFFRRRKFFNRRWVEDKGGDAF